MKARTLLIAAVVAVALVGLAGDAHSQQEKNKGVKYATPKAVFDAAMKAIAKDDWKALHDCLTPDDGKMLAGQAVLGGALAVAFAAFDKENGAATAKAVEAIFKKHGLTKDVLDKIKLDKRSKDPKKQAEDLKKLAEPIKDRGAFLQDMMSALNKFGKKVKPPTAKAKLEDVKIDGNKASGTVVSKEGGKEDRDTVTFVKVDGGWRMEMPKRATKGKAPRPPSPGALPRR